MSLQRSADMVQELEQFNEQLRRIAAKKKSQQGEQAAKGPGLEDQQRGLEHGQQDMSSSSSSVPLSSPPQAPTVNSLDQPANESSKKKADSNGAVMQGSRLGNSDQNKGDGSAVSRALSLLDSLLPEEQVGKK